MYDIASPTPTQPAFDVGYQEDDDFADDTLQCSFTPASAPPSWTSCGYADTYEPPPLPPEDVRYLFRARTIDDFGRSANTVTVPYDPKPCTIGPIRPLRTLPFEVHGVPYRLSCWGSVDVALGLYVLGQDGHRHPFAYVFKHDASVGGTGTLRTVDRRGRLLLYPNGSLDIALRQDRSATLAVYADPDIGMGGNSIEGLPTIRVFTIRR